MVVFFLLLAAILIVVGWGFGWGCFFDDPENKRRFWNEKRLYKLFRPGYVLELYKKTTKGWEKFETVIILATVEIGFCGCASYSPNVSASSFSSITPSSSSESISNPEVSAPVKYES